MPETWGIVRERVCFTLVHLLALTINPYPANVECRVSS